MQEGVLHAGYKGKQLVGWDLASGHQLWNFSLMPPCEGADPDSGMLFHSPTRVFTLTKAAGSVQLWDMQERKVLQTLQAQQQVQQQEPWSLPPPLPLQP